jgi:hypothetical protein
MATVAMSGPTGPGYHEHPWALTGPEDPSAGSGVAAPIGKLFIRDTGTAGTLWIKAGAADTAWKLITQAA